MLIHKEVSPVLYDEVRERNLIRQYSYLADCISIGLQTEPSAFDQSFLWALHHLAVANLSLRGGRYRTAPAYVGKHVPPRYEEVPEQMDQYFSTVHEHWYEWSSTELAAYSLWRLLWIHPFPDGNGRVGRAVAYYVLSVREGIMFPGTRILPERIRENKAPYYAALREADAAWAEGHLNFSSLAQYLGDQLLKQLQEANEA